MSVEYWADQPTDQPWTLNGFAGTFAITTHSGVAQELQNYVMECFPKAERFSRIPMEDVNRVLNEVWEGPGSMPKLVQRTLELRHARQSRSEETIRLDEVKTIDDYSDDDFDVKLDVRDDEDGSV